MVYRDQALISQLNGIVPLTKLEQACFKAYNFSRLANRISRSIDKVIPYTEYLIPRIH